MHSYKTLDHLNALTGALRSLDLLGQLPLRDPTVALSDEIHDQLALADDWQAVAEDLLQAFKAYTDCMRTEEILDQIGREQTIIELTEALSRLAEDIERKEDEAERQMELFQAGFRERVG